MERTGRRDMFVEAFHSCFVAIPHDPAFMPIWQAVEQALNEFDVRALPNEMSPDLIESSSFVIADVTLPNSTVFYQLGLADALRKPTLLIAQSSDALPPDITLHQVLIYRPEEVSKLQQFLRYWIKDTLAITQRNLRPIAAS
jgi:hypothetical protein